MNATTLLDGGMGKELRRIGAPFRQPEWSALALNEAPEMVVRAHTNFIDAGAEVIITNNYAVVPYHLGDEMIATRGAELTALAGRLARQAADGADRDVLVAGSLPPLFGSYEPDQFDPVRAPALYRMIVSALAPHVDLWLTETLSTVAELEAIANVVAAGGAGKPLWASFTLPERWADDTITLRSGESIDDVISTIDDHDDLVEAALFNCALPEQIGPALDVLAAGLHAAGLDVRTGAYANAFPESRDDGYAANAVILERRDDLTPHRYADIVGEWIAGGATIVGGCCDMYPEHIAELARRFL
ncbi:MAG: homocysteine S-methyltransferase family protein [Ilumatobacter sp.]|nr:homocysteine S-methyltransferase family protein [Ilumatobacter sp.]